MTLESSLASPTHATAAHRRRRATGIAALPLHWLDPLVLAVAAPLALLPERFPLAAIAVGLALLCVPYGVRLLTERRLSVFSPAFWAILFLGLVVLPLNAWLHPYFWRLGFPEFVRLVWGLAACLALINWCNPRLHARCSVMGLQHAQAILDRRVLLATLGYLLLGAAIVAIGILAMRHNTKFEFLGQWADLLPRLSTADVGLGARLGFNPNRIAGAAILFLPLTFALLLSPLPGVRLPIWLPLKAALLALTLFFGGALAITQSRAGLLAGGVALLLVMLLAGRRGWIPLALAAMLALAAVEVYGVDRLLAAVYVTAPGGTNIDVPASSGTNIDAPAPTLFQQVLADQNVAGRLMIWRRALFAIQAQPLTGLGLGTFEQVAQEPFPPMPDWRPDNDIYHAHNLFLQTALDLGIPGLTAFVLLVLLAGASVVRLFANTLAGSPARFWSVGMLGVWLAFVLYSLLDAMTVGARPAITYWVMLGLCIGMGEQVTLFQNLARDYRLGQST